MDVKIAPLDAINVSLKRIVVLKFVINVVRDIF